MSSTISPEVQQETSRKGNWHDVEQDCTLKENVKTVGKETGLSAYFSQPQNNFLFQSNKLKQEEKKRQDKSKIEKIQLEQEIIRKEEAKAAEEVRKIRCEEQKVLEGLKLKQTQEFIKSQNIGYFIAHFDVQGVSQNRALTSANVPLTNSSSYPNMKLTIIVTLIEADILKYNESKGNLVEKFIFEVPITSTLSSLQDIISSRYKHPFKIFKAITYTRGDVDQLSHFFSALTSPVIYVDMLQDTPGFQDASRAAIIPLLRAKQLGRQILYPSATVTTQCLWQPPPPPLPTPVMRISPKNLVECIDWGSQVNNTIKYDSIEISANKDGNPSVKNFRDLREQEQRVKDIELKNSEAVKALETQMSYKDDRILPESEAQRLASRDSFSSYSGLFSNAPKVEQPSINLKEKNKINSKSSNVINTMKSEATIVSIDNVQVGVNKSEIVEANLPRRTVSLVCSPPSSPRRQDRDIDDNQDKYRNNSISQPRLSSTISAKSTAKVIDVYKEKFDLMYSKYIAAGGPSLNHHPDLNDSEMVWIKQEDYYKVLYFYDTGRIVNDKDIERVEDEVSRCSGGGSRGSKIPMLRAERDQKQFRNERESGYQKQRYDKNRERGYEVKRYDVERDRNKDEEIGGRERDRYGSKRDRDWDKESENEVVKSYKILRVKFDERRRSDKGVDLNQKKKWSDNHGRDPSQEGGCSSSSAFDQFGREKINGDENCRSVSRDARKNESDDTPKFCHWGNYCQSRNCSLRHDGADHKKNQESKLIFSSKQSCEARDDVDITDKKPIKHNSQRCRFGHKCARRNDNPPCRYVHLDELPEVEPEAARWEP